MTPKSMHKQISEIVKDGGQIHLYGGVGAGKTTLVKKIAQEFGLNPDKIKSPTYTYYRKYTINPTQDFYHFDLYRLEKLDQNLLAEILEILSNQKNILAIEWPDHFAAHLPQPKVNVQITIEEGDTRKYLLNF